MDELGERFRRGKLQKARSGQYLSSRAPYGYRVMIQRKGKVLYSDYFESAHQAAEAYDREARKLFGKLARLNFPREGELRA